MKILITGSNGFIGKNLVKHLMGEGHGVAEYEWIENVVPDWAGSATPPIVTIYIDAQSTASHDKSIEVVDGSHDITGSNNSGSTIIV